MRHWTAESTKDYLFAIAQDFVCEIEHVMDDRGLTQKYIAEKLDVTERYVSQVISNPDNLTLESMIEWVKALGMKVAVVPYDDNDIQNAKGPIYAGVFCDCWKALGSPATKWDFDEAVRVHNNGGGLLPK